MQFRLKCAQNLGRSSMLCQTEKQSTVAIVTEKKTFKIPAKRLENSTKRIAASAGIYLTDYSVQQPAAPIFETRFFSHSDFP